MQLDVIPLKSSLKDTMEWLPREEICDLKVLSFSLVGGPRSAFTIPNKRNTFQIQPMANWINIEKATAKHWIHRVQIAGICFTSWMPSNTSILTVIFNYFLRLFTTSLLTKKVIFSMIFIFVIKHLHVFLTLETKIFPKLFKMKSSLVYTAF